MSSTNYIWEVAETVLVFLWHMAYSMLYCRAVWKLGMKLNGEDPVLSVCGLKDSNDALFTGYPGPPGPAGSPGARGERGMCYGSKYVHSQPGNSTHAIQIHWIISYRFLRTASLNQVVCICPLKVNYISFLTFISQATYTTMPLTVRP